MITSRQRVLETIQSREVVTAEEVSRLLHTTAANARHHLSTLRDEGVVQVTGQRLAGGRGRPADLYRLSQPLLQHNLDGLAHALLLVLLSQPVPGAEEAGWMEQVASRLIDTPEISGKNLTQRLTQAMQCLNRLSYRARWEAHAQGPRILFQHCPYAALLAQHPDVCTLDRLLLRNLLGVPVQHLSRREESPAGLPQCLFKVGQ